MNIKQISYGLIGGIMLVGTCAGCTDDKYVNKAKEQAVKYLNGNDLLKAERHATQQADNGYFNGEAINYWDSLLIEAKSKEAYAKGQQIIRDSINGIHHRKEKFKPNLDTLFYNNVIENSKSEYAQYINAEDFISARENAPESKRYGLCSQRATEVHYWNLITIAGKQNKAYQKGMEDARRELTHNQK